jgi:hypothetical protein
MDFLTYKKFHESEGAEALTQILKDNKIEFEVTEDRDSLDSLYGDRHLNRQIFVKVKKTDFSKVDAILATDSEKHLGTVGEEHYLYEFTEEELFDILSKPDEWSELDFQLAKKILKERGKEINNETIDLLRKQRINELAKPEDSSKVWIYAGYLFALLGGLLGIFMGLALITTKKTLPNGQRVYTYSLEHRNHGTRILIIGIIMFLISLVIRIMTAEF